MPDISPSPEQLRAIVVAARNLLRALDTAKRLPDTFLVFQVSPACLETLTAEERGFRWDGRTLRVPSRFNDAGGVYGSCYNLERVLNPKRYPFRSAERSREF